MPNFSGIWTVTQQMQAKGASTWPATPGAPTIGTATNAGSTSISVAFTAPACAGYPATITEYLATSTPGCITGTAASSPITVSGLTTGTAYTFKVKAQNATGYGACSAASNSATPAVIVGQQEYTTAGSYSWVAPVGVTSVSTIAVAGGGTGKRWNQGCCSFGSGGAGGGGSLSYKNNTAVTPGSSYTVVVGAAAGQSSFTTVAVAGGGQNATGSGPICGVVGGAGGVRGAGDGGGNGGCGSNARGGQIGGGGGGGGYAGKGGDGGSSCLAATNGAGGGGGGGGAKAGGGVGLLGQGGNGAAGSGSPGGGGSGGTAGRDGLSPGGGSYGGGGAGRQSSGSNPCYIGASGAVRIIWPGSTRSFPSTCTGNL